jgi:multidrug efflux pump subunit AcrB
MKWDGEWHITIEVFRDLGLAFAAVLVLIYILVVGWFQSFVTPLVIMRRFRSRWSASCRRTPRSARSSPPHR